MAACEDGGAALEAIGEHQPDVAFLDIRMPGLTGLEVAAAAAEASPATQIVFVTAYDQYAIEAFERGAVDYLLKPIARERLVGHDRRGCRRAWGTPSAHGATLAALIKELGAALPAAKPAEAAARVDHRQRGQGDAPHHGRRRRLLPVRQQVHDGDDGRRARRCCARRCTSCSRSSIPTHFKQIHRSTIVNLRMVAAIVRDDSGRGTMRLKNRPETLPVSLTVHAAVPEHVTLVSVVYPRDGPSTRRIDFARRPTRAGKGEARSWTGTTPSSSSPRCSRS